MKNYAPYIGITDFMRREESLRMLNFFSELPDTYVPPHKLMVGVMMSRKTLHGLPTKWTDAFPKKEDIADIFVDDPLLFNTIHYADYDGVDLPDSFAQVVRYGGPALHAVQLDMVWPSAREICLGFSQGGGKHLSVILQVGALALHEVGDCRLSLVKKLEGYTNVIDGILLDMSMGKGRPMDAESLLVHIDTIARALPWLRVGVAGGLGPDTLDLVLPILAKYPNVSIDAQSKLRASGNAMDPIDWSRAEDYVAKALTLCTEVQPTTRSHAFA